MKRRLALLAALIMGGVTAVAGCGSGDSSSSTSGGGSSSEARLTIGFVAHAQGNTFIKSIIAAAQQAGVDFNADLKVAGTEGIDATAELQRVNDVVAAGAQGVATSGVGDSMANGVNGLVNRGVPVVQWNVSSPRINTPYVGEASVVAWKILGDAILAKLGGASATGKVIIGTCAPGLLVLQARVKGVMQGLAPASGLQFVGPLTVPVDPVGNLSAWQQAVAANPDAKALVGVCAPDLASLGKVNAANGDKFVAGGSDLTTENLNAIKQGHAFMTIGQTGFVQGYLPVLMLTQALRSHAALPAGQMVSSGVQVVTKDQITMPFGLPTVSFDKLEQLENDPSAAAAYYKPLFANGGKLANWQSLLIPSSNALP